MGTETSLQIQWNLKGTGNVIGNFTATNMANLYEIDKFLERHKPKSSFKPSHKEKFAKKLLH